MEKQNRQTEARRVIWDEIKGDTSHPSADELYERVRKRLPRISLGTVYRNLDLLCQSGKIRCLEGGGTQKRFDPNPGNHYHFRCRRCGRVLDLSLETAEEIDRAVGRLMPEGYVLQTYNLEAIGLCPSCMSEGVSMDSEDNKDEERRASQ